MKEKWDCVLGSFRSLNLSNVQAGIPLTEWGQRDWVCLGGEGGEDSLRRLGSNAYARWDSPQALGAKTLGFGEETALEIQAFQRGPSVGRYLMPYFSGEYNVGIHLNRTYIF